MTRIIAIQVPKVKPTRVAPRHNRPFGRGILPSAPSYRAPYTAADVEWHALELATAEDRQVDAMYAEFEAQDAVDRGTYL